MADGSMRRASDLQIGEQVLTGNDMFALVQDILRRREFKPHLQIEAEEHPVLTFSDFKMAKALRGTDQVIINQNGPEVFSAIYPTTNMETVFNFSLALQGESDDQISIAANGFLVGNFSKQEQLRQNAYDKTEKIQQLDDETRPLIKLEEVRL